VIIHAIDSHPDAANQFTRLELGIPADPAAPLRLNFRCFTGGPLVSAMSAALKIPFIIRFRKYDLAKKRMFWGYFDFAAAGRPVVTPVPAERKLVLAYTATAFRVIPPRPEDGSVPPALAPDVPAMGFDPITVTLTLHASVRTVNHGWINFDLEHTYPRQIPERDAAFGWEQTVHYPFLDFAGSDPGKFEPVITGLLNFSAVYKATKSATAVNTATGIAIHVEDVYGHDTGAWYNDVADDLNYALRNSIHLQGREFVRPPAYKLSGGDAFGYGGNAMVYRIRAFHVPGAAAGAPVDWHDVLDIYRSWLRTRFSLPDEPSLFFDKLRPERKKNAPADLMAPHTVISNYGLDGSVDPGAPGSPQEQLSGWLEMHPLRVAAPDSPAAGSNATFVHLANRLRTKFPDPAAVKLEVQGWGIEQASFFHFICGYPPLTNVISGSDAKFKAGVNALAANQNTAFCITTDPLNTCFNALRFGGHIRFRAGAPWAEVTQAKHWDALVKPPLQANVRNRNCAVTVTKIGAKQFNRIWIVDHFPGVEKVPNSPLTARFKAAQKRDEWGVLLQSLPVIGTGLYRGTQKQICPTADVARIYVDDWVKPWVLGQNVRILEFMKHSIGAYFCYDAGHTHIVPHPHVSPQTNPAYTNVIGRGSWYTRRLQCMFFDVHEQGKVFDADPFCTFRLSHEFQPREALAPYIDQYYSGDEKFDFVYSHLVAHQESTVRGGIGIHPGYKEGRKVPGAILKLDWMLSPDRDKVPAPPKRDEKNDGAVSAPNLELRNRSFNEWRQQCVDHFNRHFKVEQWGLAPRGYPTSEAPGNVPFNPQNPLAPTNPPTYTYNRCVQQSFNLRANIFTTGASAVRGVRIHIPSQWLEDPRDYDNEAVEHAVRAARMQMQWADFFRRGRMLGETRIFEVNDVPGPVKEIWAWGNGGNTSRRFDNVKPLMDHIGQDDVELGTAWRSRPVVDFISKPWDREFYFGKTYNEIMTTPMIHHRIWQHGEGNTRKVLYAFANVSNTPAKVEFLFSRGLQGIAQATPWRRTIHVYAPAASAPQVEDAWLAKRDTVNIPARSFAAVVVER